MQKSKERKYVTSLALIFIFLIVATIASIVYGFMEVARTNDFNNNVFELIYIVFHLIVCFTGLAFCIAYLKGNNYHILKNMMYKYKTDVISRPAMIIMSIFCFAGLATFIYFFLVLLNFAPVPFHFPIFLRLIMVNTPFTIFIVTLYFICYPLVYKK